MFVLYIYIQSKTISIPPLLPHPKVNSSFNRVHIGRSLDRGDKSMKFDTPFTLAKYTTVFPIRDTGEQACLQPYLRAKDVGSPPLTNVRFPWKRDAALPFAHATLAQPRAPQDRRSPCLDRKKEKIINENWSWVLKLIIEIVFEL